MLVQVSCMCVCVCARAPASKCARARPYVCRCIDLRSFASEELWGPGRAVTKKGGRREDWQEVVALALSSDVTSATTNSIWAAQGDRSCRHDPVLMHWALTCMHLPGR